MHWALCNSGAAVAPGAQEVQVEKEEAPATLLEVPAGHCVALMEGGQ